MNKEQRAEREAKKRELDARIQTNGIIEVIRTIHLERVFMMAQRMRCELALGAFLRTQEGWRVDLPEKDRKEIATRVLKMMDGSHEPGRHASIIASSRAGSAVFIDQEELLTWNLEYAAKKLPVWDFWAKDVLGFGARSLGVVVGEAGDIGSYRDHGRLWKRMGLAVIDGIRQGGLSKLASADDWIEHGYNRPRRSRMYVIGDVMIKQVNGYYRDVYLQRKDYERQKAEAQGLTVCPSAKIPKSGASDYISDGHIHKKAQRYMEKKLLRHLWQKWRRAEKILAQEEKVAA